MWPRREALVKNKSDFYFHAIFFGLIEMDVAHKALEGRHAPPVRSLAKDVFLCRCKGCV